jgi:hypothetical protein
MSLSLFMEEAHQTLQAWCPLEYIANEDFFIPLPKSKPTMPT